MDPVVFLQQNGRRYCNETLGLFRIINITLNKAKFKAHDQILLSWQHVFFSSYQQLKFILNIFIVSNIIINNESFVMSFGTLHQRKMINFYLLHVHHFVR